MEVYLLDYVLVVIEYLLNVFCIYCVCEMWIIVVFIIFVGCVDSLKNEKNRLKLIYRYEVNKVVKYRGYNEISNIKFDFDRVNLEKVGLMF